MMHNRSLEWCIYDCLHLRIIISVWRKGARRWLRSGQLVFSVLAVGLANFPGDLQGYLVLVLLFTGCPSYLRCEVQAVRALYNQVLLELQNTKIDAKNRVNLSFKNSVCIKFFLNMTINGLVWKSVFFCY